MLDFSCKVCYTISSLMKGEWGDPLTFVLRKGERMANAAEKVYGLIKETVESCGVSLWDVRFVKEGASRYLRIYIDSEAGVTLDDCTAVSHAIDPVIDEADPIDVSYFMEVCSPGLNRELTRPEHYAAFVGSKVKLRLYKAENGSKEVTGFLKTGEEPIVVETENGERGFTLKEISKANLCDFE